MTKSRQVVATNKESKTSQASSAAHRGSRARKGERGPNRCCNRGCLFAWRRSVGLYGATVNSHPDLRAPLPFIPHNGRSAGRMFGDDGGLGMDD